MNHNSATSSQEFPPGTLHDINMKAETVPDRSTQHTFLQQRLNANTSEGNAPEQENQPFTSAPTFTEEELSRINKETQSLAEKLRTHYREGSSAGSKAKTFTRGLFQFHMVTFSFMAFVYLVPWALEEYDSVTYLSLNLLFVYIFVMIQSNWALSIITESNLPKNIPDLPPQSSEMDEASLQNLNMKFSKYHNTSTGVEKEKEGEASADSTTNIISPPPSFATLPRLDKFGMIWKYCDVCNQFRPPRTYHCKFCRKCILRRDHHCHMIGNCIGHYNQRFFVVLCFYLLLAASIGFSITASYLSSELQEAHSWTWYIFPYTIILFLFRYVSWKMLLLTFHAYLMFIFGVLSLLYWLSQLSLISMGKTLVEVIKQMDVKVTSSLSENFHLVFGNNWFLSFIFPCPAIFKLKQTHGGVWFDRVTIYGKRIEDI